MAKRARLTAGHQLYTIGHSTRSYDELIEALRRIRRPPMPPPPATSSRRRTPPPRGRRPPPASIAAARPSATRPLPRRSAIATLPRRGRRHEGDDRIGVWSATSPREAATDP